MSHLSEDCKPLHLSQVSIHTADELLLHTANFSDVCIVWLPPNVRDLNSVLGKASFGLGEGATLIIIGDVVDLVHAHTAINRCMRYQQWIAIRRTPVLDQTSLTQLPNQHFGALIYTRYQATLRHTKTRIKYTYCPSCGKTTKDYGGKKHTYHEYGTLISDVWTDIEGDLDEDITPIVQRFADLFGIDPYHELRVLDCRPLAEALEKNDESQKIEVFETREPFDANRLMNGDCLEQLRQIPSNSIDFVFADPPYNLSKVYNGYSDDLVIGEYFKWCDEWLTEAARVLKPGRTCAILNIPLWAIRHFIHMETILEFQNWIVWDALAFPVRLIMPAHYPILCFTKGVARELPGLIGQTNLVNTPSMPETFQALSPLADDFCLRSSCVAKRKRQGTLDHHTLTDMWSDIHRLKHNSRRVDHPCQLPPHLMARLLAIFTNPGEIVLDCFNGSGTTTLVADQLNRRYVGIELSEEYHQLALSRHREIEAGLDPFRKEDRTLIAKNSPVKRLTKQKYEVSKKTLQLEVKRVAQELGRLPSREEMIANGRYPIEYYDNYFSSWGEVCAAARTTGMSETREPPPQAEITPSVEQLQLL